MLARDLNTYLGTLGGGEGSPILEPGMLFHGQNKQLFCNEKRIADPDGTFDHL